MVTKLEPGTRTCGFCASGNHERCPGAVTSGVPWMCACGCVAEPKCTRCKSSEDVNPDTWSCNRPDDCDAAVAARQAANPTHRLLEEIYAKHGLDGPKQAASLRMPKQRPAAPKPASRCECGCGTPTGGKFAPGHDARLRGVLQRAFADGDDEAGRELIARGGAWEAKTRGNERARGLAVAEAEVEAYLARRVAERYAAAVESGA